jgi:hypothetical protein
MSCRMYPGADRAGESYPHFPSCLLKMWVTFPCPVRAYAWT